MKLSIVLNSGDLTSHKDKLLKEFNASAVILANQLLSSRKSKKLMELHRSTYSTSKETTRFNSQVICDIERQICKSKARKIKAITIKFNVPRNCKTFNTKTNFFVRFGIRPNERIAIPISQDGSFKRFQFLISNGWTCKTYGLTSDMKIIAYLSKEKEIKTRNNVLGIDINSRHFAVSIVSPNGKILYQTYFGRNIWARRKQIMKRRAFLQSVGNKSALKRLRNTERNFVRTNLGQMVSQIIKLANRFNAEIVIENLKRFKVKGRIFNREVMNIPFAEFKEILSSRCFDNDILLKAIDSWHTSKFCYRCGAVGKGHSANYSIFKCKCGFIANADRKASVNIAVKSLLERNNVLNKHSFQISNRRVLVSGLIRPDAVGLFNRVVQSNQLMESHCL